MLRSVTLLTLVFATIPAGAADLDRYGRPATGRFLATCEHLGQFCQAEGCGLDQIDAALACRAACPGSAVMTVQPAACPLPRMPVRVVLRSRG